MCALGLSPWHLLSLNFVREPRVLYWLGERSVCPALPERHFYCVLFALIGRTGLIAADSRYCLIL